MKEPKIWFFFVYRQGHTRMRKVNFTIMKYQSTQNGRNNEASKQFPGCLIPIVNCSFFLLPVINNKSIVEWISSLSLQNTFSYIIVKNLIIWLSYLSTKGNLWQSSTLTSAISSSAWDHLSLELRQVGSIIRNAA